MGESERADGDAFKVTWASASRSTFDVKAFAKDNPGTDLSHYYKTSSYRTFKVTERKDG